MFYVANYSQSDKSHVIYLQSLIRRHLCHRAPLNIYQRMKLFLQLLDLIDGHLKEASTVSKEVNNKLIVKVYPQC